MMIEAAEKIAKQAFRFQRALLTKKDDKANMHLIKMECLIDELRSKFEKQE